MKPVRIPLEVIFAALAFVAGCAVTGDSADRASEQSPPAAPTVIAWQDEQDAEIAAVTALEVLASFVASPETADALLARIGPAYAGDPMALVQANAVSLAFLSKREPLASAGRKIWIESLERRLATTDDDYVKTFCRQQLRLCR